MSDYRYRLLGLGLMALSGVVSCTLIIAAIWVLA